MANLDKTSVRNEVEKLKTDFEQLRRNGKVTVEVQAIMSSILFQLRAVRSRLVRLTPVARTHLCGGCAPLPVGAPDETPAARRL